MQLVTQDTSIWLGAIRVRPTSLEGQAIVPPEGRVYKFLISTNDMIMHVGWPAFSHQGTINMNFAISFTICAYPAIGVHTFGIGSFAKLIRTAASRTTHGLQHTTQLAMIGLYTVLSIRAISVAGAKLKTYVCVTDT
jgi:hypothetical protein